MNGRDTHIPGSPIEPDIPPRAVTPLHLHPPALAAVAAGLVLHRGAPDELRLVVGVGFCSTYTTFSTAVVDVVRLVQRGRAVAGALYAVGGLLAAGTAAGAGLVFAGM
ncbi:fluoride efflux transporter FluC [Rhodococcus sp. NPDC003318]|uniref:fluoride efflux transporter FluC n=1 Tax=Rhodococcus sp. NPDC003318 TaxID=3364503 RepID=UPI0036839471